MLNKNYWELFESTGSIDAYVSYKKQIKNKQIKHEILEDIYKEDLK